MVTVHKPINISELTSLYTKYPESVLFAGGTALMNDNRFIDNAYNVNENGSHNFMIISLENIDELKKVRRKENYIDIGSCVTISRILNIGQNFVPKLLYESLLKISNPTVRKSATIGGNICLASPFSDLICPLAVLDSRLEIRGSSGSRWISVASVASSKEKIFCGPGEFLVRIRIPLRKWDIEINEKIDISDSSELSILKFLSAVNINKGTITECRIVIGGMNPLIFRSNQIEMTLNGHKLPISEKLISSLISEYANNLERLGKDFISSDYHKSTALRLINILCYKINSTKR